jgi:hypothetical protein
MLALFEMKVYCEVEMDPHEDMVVVEGGSILELSVG